MRCVGIFCDQKITEKWNSTVYGAIFEYLCRAGKERLCMAIFNILNKFVAYSHFLSREFLYQAARSVNQHVKG